MTSPLSSFEESNLLSGGADHDSGTVTPVRHLRNESPARPSATVPEEKSGTENVEPDSNTAAARNNQAILSNYAIDPLQSSERAYTGPSAGPGHLTTSQLPIVVHTRTPSTAGLSLRTDVIPHTPVSAAGEQPVTPTRIIEPVGLHTSSSAPYDIQRLTPIDNVNMAGSLSPGSALSSPAIAALADITPLPSPLFPGESPNPFRSLSRPPSSGNFSTSGPTSRENAMAMLSRSSSTSSPSKKYRAYAALIANGGDSNTAQPQAAMQQMHNAQPVNNAQHGRNRSVSDFKPETLTNVRPRHVTTSYTQTSRPSGAESGALAAADGHLHREKNLAARLESYKTHGPDPSRSLPSPPPSNRSVTESEGEEVAEDKIPLEPVDFYKIHEGEGEERREVTYRSMRLLGQGTFSKVYLATSLKVEIGESIPDEKYIPLHKLVAVKIVNHPQSAANDTERIELSLKREVAMLKIISHPCIVNLRAFEDAGKRALLVLDYCPGGDLFDLASEHRDVLISAGGGKGLLIRRIFSELVAAVRFLHTKQIVHRDIKLENVLVNLRLHELSSLQSTLLSYPHPIITLTDLGLSRLIPQPPLAPTLTTRCGSDDYAAPELLLGQEYDGRRTDAWALGVLLYALLEGRLPFDPIPGVRGIRMGRSKAAHRIARCEWLWWRFGDEVGTWVGEKGVGGGLDGLGERGVGVGEVEGAREVVEGLLKKRGRMPLEDVEQLKWVKEGIQVEGGLCRVTDESSAMDTRS